MFVFLRQNFSSNDKTEFVTDRDLFLITMSLEQYEDID